MNKNRSSQILIAPLDWGLGHTSRCIPIVHHLVQSGHQPLFAGNSAQIAFIVSVFPSIETIHLDGYDIQYSKVDLLNKSTIAAQIPKITTAIAREHEWLSTLLKERPIQGIISDNRYGLYNESTSSVIITHQLQILTGMGAWANQQMHQMHLQRLQPFQQIWIPDVASTPNLSGQLGHVATHLPNSHYIGPLSQFSILNQSTTATNDHILVLLSGPEPQRSKLEGMLLKQLQNASKPVVLVSGTQHTTAINHPNIQHINISSGAELYALMQAAQYVICRSGYSTLMDLAYTGKPALLIPTPGQTEQAYLAEQMALMGPFATKQQQNLHIDDISIPTSKDLGIPKEAFYQHIAIIDNWLINLG